MSVSKEELTRVLHHITKVINDSRGVWTAEYNFKDYENMFLCNNPEENHKSWMEARKKAGWVYGEVKDIDKKTHPCLVDYSELPESEKIKDLIAQGIINYYKENLDNRKVVVIKYPLNEFNLKTIVDGIGSIHHTKSNSLVAEFPRKYINPIHDINADIEVVIPVEEFREVDLGYAVSPLISIDIYESTKSEIKCL